MFSRAHPFIRLSRVIAIGAPQIVLLAVSLGLRISESRADMRPVPLNASQMLRISDDGATPKELRMQKKDGVVFFVNTSPSALVTIAINYGQQRTHCANALLDIGADNIVRSNTPLGQFDFVSSCFPDSGIYPVTILGLPSFPDGFLVSVIVE